MTGVVMRLSRWVVLAVFAFCLSCLSLLVSSPPVKAGDNETLPVSGVPVQWKIQRVGCGILEGFCGQYVVSSVLADEGWKDYPARDILLYVPWTGVTKQLTDTPDTEDWASIGGSKILWARGPNPHSDAAGPWSIYIYSLQAQSVEAIVTYAAATGVWGTAVTESHAAWLMSTGEGTDIYLWDFATDDPVCLTSVGSHFVRDLSLADGHLAWQDGSILYLLDLASGEKTTLSTTEDEYSYGLQVAEGRVGWVRDRHLLLYDIASQAIETLSDEVGEFHLGAGYVAWTQRLWDGDSFSGEDVYLRSLAGDATRRLTDDSKTKSSLQVDSRFVVWVQGEMGVGALIAYDLETGLTSIVTPDGAGGCKLEGDWVAWGDYRGRGDVFLARAVTFTDVSPDDLFNETARYLVERRVISGFSDGTFRPEAPVTRQQFAKMLAKATDIPVAGAVSCPFPDVAINQDPGDPHYPAGYVGIAAAVGLIKGHDDGTFRPYDHITRAQVITMVVRAAEKLHPLLLQTPLAAYESTWGRFDPEHGPNARRAEYNGLLDDLYLPELPERDPSGPMPREEVAQVLASYLKLVERGRIPAAGPDDITPPS